jgi:CRP-like cAMP-binding protein
MMHGRAVFTGDLSFISLADSFQILGGNNSTGILHIKSQHVPSPGMIYFVDGNPANATHGSLQGLQAIYSLFGWTEGKLEFHEQKVQAKRVINSSRMEIVLDALRMLDDGVIKKVGPPSHDEMSSVQSGASKDGKRAELPVIKGPFVDYMYVIDEEEFHDGEKIVTEGGHGNWIWVILEGSVKMTRETSHGPMTIARLGEGCFVGTLKSFLSPKHVRNATVTAVGNVQLGVLDTQRLSQDYASLSSDFKGLLLSLDGRLKKITDAAVDLSAKNQKTNGLTKDKKLIIKQGSSNEGVFTITDGETHIVRRTPNGYLELLTLEKGDVFGYVPFLDVGHEPRSASVIASKDLKVSKLDGQALQEEYDQLSGTLKNIIDNVGTCVSMTTRVACH